MADETEMKSEIGLSSKRGAEDDVVDETESADYTGSADSQSLRSRSSDSVDVVENDSPPSARRGWIVMDRHQHANGEGTPCSDARRGGHVMETSALQRAMIFEHLRSPEQVRVHVC